MSDDKKAIKQREMPIYTCHKHVRALNISAIHVDKNDGDQARESDGNVASLIPFESGFRPVRVSAEYMSKHNPEVGGYYIVYEDGYKSFSPAGPFLGGYSLDTDDASRHQNGAIICKQN